MEDDVSYEVEDRVAYITIHREHRRNALTPRTVEALVDLAVRAGDDDDVWVIVLTGSGDKAFCAGVDLKYQAEQSAAGHPPRRAPMGGTMRNVFEAFLELYKPTIAALNGAAVGGGCELALACDLRIAAEHAQIGLPEAKRGMGANFASTVLPRLIPRGIAFEMLYLGDYVSAEEALRWGLVNRVVPSADLADEVRSVARAIAENAPLTLRRYKETAVKGWDLPVPTALRLNVGPDPYGSSDREEGTRAFVEGRKPRWQGR